MRVRAIDTDGDWQFGKGRNDYRQNTQAIVQIIGTRLNSYLGDCFFATGDGIDWFNLLGTKGTLPLELALAATILNTQGVTGILQLSVTLDSSRRVFISYEVNTIYGRAANAFTFDTGASI